MNEIKLKIKVDNLNNDTTFKACSIHIHFSYKSLKIKTMDGIEIS